MPKNPGALATLNSSHLRSQTLVRKYPDAQESEIVLSGGRSRVGASGRLLWSEKASPRLRGLTKALNGCGGEAELVPLASALGLNEMQLRKELPVWLRSLKVAAQPLLTLSADGQSLSLDVQRA